MQPAPASHAEWWRPGPSASPAREPIVSNPLPGAGGSVPFWGLMTFLFIMVLAPQHYLPVLAPLRIALLAAGVSVAAYLFDWFRHGRPAGRPTPEIWIATAILAWAALTVPVSYWPGGSLQFLGETYVKVVAAFWLLSKVVNTQTRLERVIWGITLMGIPLAATGVGHFVSSHVGAVGTSDPTMQRIMGYESGLTRNPNDLALMLNLMLPFNVALLLRTRRVWLRTLLLATIVLYVAGVIVSFSRAGFLTLAGTFVYYMAKLLRRGRWGPAVAALVLAAATTVVLPRSYLARLATITDTEADPTGSAQARSKDLLAAVRIVWDRPVLGVGIGGNVLALNDVRGPTWIRVHNVYLEYAVELGLPGLMLFLLLFGACLMDARIVQRRIARRREADGLFHIAEGAEAALLAFGIAAMFHPVAYHLFFYMFGGIAVSVRTVYEVERSGFAPERLRAAEAPERASGMATWAATGCGERAR